METKITTHKCFKCHFTNNFYNVPYYVKGKKCKRCHTYNYFNSHTKITRKKISHNNHNSNKTDNNIKNNNNNKIIINNKNNNNNQNNQNNNNRERQNITSQINTTTQSRPQIQRISIRNDIIPPHRPQIDEIEDNDDDEYFTHNDNQYNNHHINISSNLRDNNLYNLYLNYEINHPINTAKYSWLQKEKSTNEVLKKYGVDYSCPICLETIKINEDIHITKCKHLFHYICIETSITKNKIDCPMCRCNIKDGTKKPIIDFNNNNNLMNHYILNDDYIYLSNLYNQNYNLNINNHQIHSDNHNSRGNLSIFGRIRNFFRNLFSD